MLWCLYLFDDITFRLNCDLCTSWDSLPVVLCTFFWFLRLSWRSHQMVKLLKASSTLGVAKILYLDTALFLEGKNSKEPRDERV